jgi:hypothetical protein
MSLTLRPGVASGPVTSYEVRVAGADEGPDAGRSPDTCTAQAAEPTTCVLAPLKSGDWDVWVRSVGTQPDQVSPWYRGAYGNVSSCTTADAQIGACEKLDKGPGGGLVFYDAGSVQPWGRYLEAAPANWAGGGNRQSSVLCAEGKPGYNTSLNTGTDIGTGLANTTLFIKECGDDTAAGKAMAYQGGGNSGWFLPSKDELNELWKNRAAAGEVFCRFWSSSQGVEDAVTAWYQYFDKTDKGYQFDSRKDVDGCAWPIRAF